MKFVKRLFSPTEESSVISRVFDGVDNAILTPQEKMRLLSEHLKNMVPFKIVQRILVSAIAFIWVVLILNYVVALWLNAEEVRQGLLDLIAMEFVWGPTIAGFSLYFLGGARMPKKE